MANPVTTANGRVRRALFIALLGAGLALAAGRAAGGDGAGARPVPTAARPADGYTVAATGLAGPRGLVFGPSGELYVAEQSGGSIAKVTPGGRVTRIAEGFSDPHDLAIDGKGNLYLAESGANRVARISPAGAITTWLDKVEFPADLDFSPRGELLVCELHRGRVVAFKGREMLRVIASGLSWPHGLAFGKAGEVFINENTGNRIAKVGADGKLRKFAEVERPVGLVRARSGDFYVAQPQVGKV
ncbi:MAG: hypothetical protein Fur0039_19840 [Rhodocyclaceae bacterium]